MKRRYEKIMRQLAENNISVGDSVIYDELSNCIVFKSTCDERLEFAVYRTEILCRLHSQKDSGCE